MEMTILDREDITHVVLTGRLDTTGAEEIGDRFAAATAGQARPAVIDLSAIEFMASRGIGLLVANSKKLMKAGHKMVLLNPQGLVASVLRTSQIDKVLPVVRHLDEAMGILLGVPTDSIAAGPGPGTSADESPSQRAVPCPAAFSATEGRLSLTIKNDLAELKGLNAALGSFLGEHGVPQRAAYAVDLAVEELVTNVLYYAYVDFDVHLIEIELVIEGDQIILRIVDDGRPFDPRRGPLLDQHAEDPEVGGLGLLLVLDMVDALEYRRAAEKNWVEVRVRMTAAERAVDSSTTVSTGAAVEEL